ncbi:MAG: Ig-like domain-containing protein [Polyangiaceae bacterium]|nr:Ig-like domain-containing protein [Polyangiaceae bacterium]
MSPSRNFLGGLVLGAVGLLPNLAQAQSCARPDVLETFPANGSSEVPVNATLSAHYFASAEYDGEPIVLVELGGERRELLGNFSPNEGSLSLDPMGFLKPNTSYMLEWPALRGIGSASRGKGAKLNFTVGSGADTAPPEFGGVRKVKYHLDRDQDGCAETVQDRFVFELSLEPVSDESASKDLTLVVFQTQKGATTPPQPVLTASFPEDGRVSVARRIEDSLGEVCFAALVRDLSGKVSASADRLACTKTVEPPFFHGCAVASLRRSPSRGVGFFGVGFAFILGGMWARRRTRGA